MKLRNSVIFTFLGSCTSLINPVIAQSTYSVEAVVEEATKNSQLERLASELLDGIGGRLVGSPQMKQANDWVVKTYESWGIKAENQAYGEWKAWERGNTTIELIAPRKQQLVGRQLAWTPHMKKAIEAESIITPIFKTEADVSGFLAKVKGKLVLFSPYLPSGRPDYQWKEHATPSDYDQYMAQKDLIQKEWTESLKLTGMTSAKFISKLEEAGAAGIVINGWTGITGSNRVFDAKTSKIPQIDLNNEDYSLIYRMTKNGQSPKLKVRTESKHLGTTPVFNTIAMIPGTSHQDEYVMISAHLDAWDGAQGATDNGTGTILMMEVARIIQKLNPNPKRTILIGHWNSEEQGLNGSTAFVHDHPEIIKNLKVLFNQDSGTGRINSINGQGFKHAQQFLTRWLDKVPDSITQYIQTTFPGAPQTRGTDNVPFVAAGVPAFAFGSQNWGYGAYTWHTNLDTYDKIVFQDVIRNVITTVILTIEAANDDQPISNEKIELENDKDGNPGKWPELREPTRKGRVN